MNQGNNSGSPSYFSRSPVNDLSRSLSAVKAQELTEFIPADNATPSGTLVWRHPFLVWSPVEDISEQQIDERIGDIFIRIASMASLKEDWDSFGSIPPTDFALLMAKWLIRQVVIKLGSIAIPRNVVPLSGGGVQINWVWKNSEFELEIGAEGHLGYLITKGSGAARVFEEGEATDPSKILEIISSVAN